MRPISGGIFTEVERVMAPTQARFEVAENSVDPLELGQSFRFASADHRSFMDTSSGSNRAEACQAVGVNAGAGSQAGLGPVLNGFDAETRYRGEFSAQGGELNRA